MYEISFNKTKIKSKEFRNLYYETTFFDFNTMILH